MQTGTATDRWKGLSVRAVPLAGIGDRYACLRLKHPEAEREMAASLERYGQISPVVVCEHEERLELIDGFKRLSAAKLIPGMDALWARTIDVDACQAKAAIFWLNRIAGRTAELEEAWIVQSLVREDGLSQQEAAVILGRHKSWVCRRLALLERLCPEATAELRIGVLSPTVARELLRLPHGNQAEALEAVRREALTSSETKGVVDLLLMSADRRQQRFVLEHPREAVARDRGLAVEARDPRLSLAGNQCRRRLSLLLDQLPRMENWLRHRGRADLKGQDLELLTPGLLRLSKEALGIAEAVEDLGVKGAEEEP